MKNSNENITILFIDDDEGWHAILSSKLKQYSIYTICCNNPEEAFLQLKNNELIRLIIHDIAADNWDGSDSIKAIKKTFNNIPIVALSGAASVTEATDAYFRKEQLMQSDNKSAYETLVLKIRDLTKKYSQGYIRWNLYFNGNRELIEQYTRLIADKHYTSIQNEINDATLHILEQIKTLRTKTSRNLINKFYPNNGIKKILISRKVLLSIIYNTKSEPKYAHYEPEFNRYEVIRKLNLDIQRVKAIEKYFSESIVKKFLNYIESWKNDMSNLFEWTIIKNPSDRFSFIQSIELISIIPKEVISKDNPIFTGTIILKSEDGTDFEYEINKSSQIIFKFTSDNFRNWLMKCGLTETAISEHRILPEEKEWLTKHSFMKD